MQQNNNIISKLKFYLSVQILVKSKENILLHLCTITEISSLQNLTIRHPHIAKYIHKYERERESVKIGIEDSVLKIPPRH